MPPTSAARWRFTATADAILIALLVVITAMLIAPM